MGAMTRTLRLVIGDEEYLAAREVAAVVARARSTAPDTAVEELVAGEASVGDLLAVLSPDLFGGAKVVVIRAAQDARKELAAAILDYAAAPDPEVTLVLVHAGGAKGKALADGIMKAGAEVSTVAKVKPWELGGFVRDEIKKLGGRCTEAAADALVTAVGGSLRELAAACHQLMADTDGKIDEAVVARYYRGRAEVSGFKISDDIVSGRLSDALESLRWALNIGVEPVIIAAALSDGMRALARVASAGRANPFQLASSLGLPKTKVERLQRDARAWSPEAIVAATRLAATCNADVRGGVEDRGYALERAVFDMVALRGGG
jgi:DNA polymerase-3 subunit delta